MTSPQQLIEGIESLWRKLVPRLEGLEGAPTPAGSRWSIAQVYAHIGRWDLITSLAIGAHAEGRPTSEWDSAFARYRSTNARWAAKDAGIDLEEARQRFQLGHGRLMQALRGLNNEDWDRYVLDLAGDVSRHYQAHIERPLAFETV